MTTAGNPPAEVPLTSLTGDQLRVRTARAQLYLIDTKLTAEPSPQQQRDHLAYLYKLEANGRLYGSGTVETEPGASRRELAYVAALSRDDAEGIAAGEPLARAGVASNSVRGHTMNEGVACYVGRAMAKRVEARGVSFDQDISTVGLSLAQLEQRAAGVALYLIALDPTDKPRSPDDTATFDAHFVWLREHEMRAALMSCGPVQSPNPLVPGIWGGGLGVVATSRAEAERIADTEPSGRAGYRSLTLCEWTLDYGLAAPIATALQILNALPPEEPSSPVPDRAWRSVD